MRVEELEKEKGRLLGVIEGEKEKSRVKTNEIETLRSKTETLTSDLESA